MASWELYKIFVEVAKARNITRASEKLHISIDDNTNFNYIEELGNYIDVYFNNKSVSGLLEINKLGEKVIFVDNEVTYEEIKLNNIEFDIYTSDDKLVKTIKTDSNGYAKVDNLELGKYYLEGTV